MIFERSLQDPLSREQVHLGTVQLNWKAMHNFTNDW